MTSESIQLRLRAGEVRTPKRVEEGESLPGEGILAGFLGEVAGRTGVGCHSHTCKAMEVGVCNRYVAVFCGLLG